MEKNDVEQANTGDVQGSEQLPDGIGNDAADPDICASVGCGRPAALTYLGRPRCQECYQDDVADGDEISNETPNHEETEMAKAKKKTTRKSAKKATKPIKSGQAGKGAKQQPKATKPQGARQPTAADKPKRISALDAAAQVLQKAGEPMTSKALIAAMAEQKLWSSPNGKTPHATLYAAMLREIGAKGGQARFKKVDRGQFAYAGGK